MISVREDIPCKEIHTVAIETNIEEYYWNSATEKRNGCCSEDIAIKNQIETIL